MVIQAGVCQLSLGGIFVFCVQYDSETGLSVLKNCFGRFEGPRKIKVRKKMTRYAGLERKHFKHNRFTCSHHMVHCLQSGEMVRRRLLVCTHRFTLTTRQEFA